VAWLFKKIPADQTREYLYPMSKEVLREMVGCYFDEIVSINKIPIFIWELVESTNYSDQRKEE